MNSMPIKLRHNHSENSSSMMQGPVACMQYDRVHRLRKTVSRLTKGIQQSPLKNPPPLLGCSASPNGVLVASLEYCRPERSTRKVSVTLFVFCYLVVCFVTRDEPHRSLSSLLSLSFVAAAVGVHRVLLCVWTHDGSALSFGHG